MQSNDITFKKLLAELDSEPDRFRDMETGIVYSSIRDLTAARRKKGIRRGKIKRIRNLN